MIHHINHILKDARSHSDAIPSCHACHHTSSVAHSIHIHSLTHIPPQTTKEKHEGNVDVQAVEGETTKTGYAHCATQQPIPLYDPPSLLHPLTHPPSYTPTFLHATTLLRPLAHPPTHPARPRKRSARAVQPKKRRERREVPSLQHAVRKIERKAHARRHAHARSAMATSWMCRHRSTISTWKSQTSESWHVDQAFSQDVAVVCSCSLLLLKTNRAFVGKGACSGPACP